MWAVDMTRHTIGVPSEGLKDSVAFMAKASLPPPPTPSTLCWWFLGISDTHCRASLLQGIEATFPNTVEPPCSKGAPQTSSIVTQELDSFRIRPPGPHCLDLNLHVRKNIGDSCVHWGLQTTYPETLRSDLFMRLITLFLLISVLYFCMWFWRARIVFYFLDLSSL